MIDFPITQLMDRDAALEWLEAHLHPDGFACLHCGSTERRIGRRNKYYPSYRCLECAGYYSIFTGTLFQKTRQPPENLVLLLRGFAQGTSTARLSRELQMSYQQVLTLRQRVQQNLWEQLPDDILEDESEVEADEVYQNAGEKRYPPHRPRRPAQTAGKQASRSRKLRQ